MKNIKLNKILLFTFAGGVLPLAFVYLVKSNRLSFFGSNVILGLTLALFIIICAYAVGYRFTTLNKEEKLINVIIGVILYTIIYACYLLFILKPESIQFLDSIVTGYYGIAASIIAIYTRSDSNEQNNK